MRVADSLRILDIGTGSGLLSLMAIQRAVSNAEVFAIDSSLACIECSKYNFYQVLGQTDCMPSNWMRWIF